MENKGKYGALYRVQSASSTRNYFSNRNYPAKRIIINGLGKIKFNPDSDIYVYFSRTQKHQCYYIFNKVLKIICEEIRKAKQEGIPEASELPNNFRAFNWHSNVNIEVIKKVKKFFSNYIPNAKLEIVTLKYLNGFSKFYDECSMKNIDKCRRLSKCPEVSDTSVFGGAYGVNDAWLELLKCCTYETEVTKISINKFFDFLLKDPYRCKVNRETLKEVMNDNDYLFSIMNYFTSNTLKNPDFFSKTNINDMYKVVEQIKQKKEYNVDKKFNDKYFDKMKRELKEEILEMR